MDRPISSYSKSVKLIAVGRGTPSGAKRIDSKVERVIAQQIDQFWLKREKPNMRALIQRVHDACRVDGLRLPRRSTIQRRIDELDALNAARRRGQKALENAATPSVGSYQSGMGWMDGWPVERDIVTRSRPW